MKLLFDQNLSWRLSRNLIDIFPESIHVREFNCTEAEDTEIWEYAKTNGFVIVSKDTDFQHRSLLYGHPPKVIWLKVGNCDVVVIETLLRKHAISVHMFALDENNSMLILP